MEASSGRDESSSQSSSSPPREGVLHGFGSFPSLSSFKGLFTKEKLPSEDLIPGLKHALCLCRENEVLVVLCLVGAASNLFLLLGSLVSSVLHRSLPSASLHGMQIVGVILFLALFGHRFLGYIAGFILRGLLRQTWIEQSEIWNIHFGWIAYRGLIDHQQIVFHDVIWLNPAEFNQTPFIVYVKEITISVGIVDLVTILRGMSDLPALTIHIDEITIDGAELYIERASDGAINLWSAMGKSTAKAGSAEKKSRTLETMQRSIETFFWKLLQNLRAKTFKIHLDWKSEEPAPTQPFVACDRILVLNVKAHILDLISSSHVPYKKSSAVRLPHWYMKKKQLLDANMKPLRFNKFIDKLVDDLTVVLLTSNPVSIPSLLAHSAANNTSNAVSFAVNSVIPTSLDLGLDLDVYSRTKGWLTVHASESKLEDMAVAEDVLGADESLKALGVASSLKEADHTKAADATKSAPLINQHGSSSWLRKLNPF